MKNEQTGNYGLLKKFENHITKNDLCSNYYIKYYLYHRYNFKEQTLELQLDTSIFNFSFFEISKIYDIDKVYKRYETLLKQIGYKTKLLSLKTKKRLITGVGIHSPFEVGFSINPHTGIPYIPASSIKGALRKYCEKKGLEDINIYFGEKNDEETMPGQIIFFDAYPYINKCNALLEKDYIAPRYGEYYRSEGKEFPIERKINLINFLTIKKDVPFNFLIASKEENYLDKVAIYLEELLLKKGIGAKTNVGFGKFKK